MQVPKFAIEMVNEAEAKAVLGILEAKFPDLRWHSGHKPTEWLGTGFPVSIGVPFVVDSLGFGSHSWHRSQGLTCFKASTQLGEFITFLDQRPAEPAKVTLEIDDRTITIDKTGIQFGRAKFSPEDVEKIIARYTGDTALEVAGRTLEIDPGVSVESQEDDVHLNRDEVNRLISAWRTVQQG